jgi:hypothetical protein
MTAEPIIGVHVVIDDTMRALRHARHRLAGVSDAEVLSRGRSSRCSGAAPGCWRNGPTPLMPTTRRLRRFNVTACSHIH